MAIMKIFNFKIILIIFFSNLSAVFADNVEDSNHLFDWADQNYAEYFRPSGGEAIEIEGYIARYYSETDTYIGTQGENVYVYGNVFGGLIHVGVISDFIQVSNQVVQDPIEKMVGTWSFKFTSGPVSFLGLPLSDLTFSLPIELGEKANYILGSNSFGGVAAYYYPVENIYMVIIFDFLGTGAPLAFEFNFDNDNAVSGVVPSENWRFTGVRK